jgi:hypothetical protein
MSENCAPTIQENLEMPVSVGSTKHFDAWMRQYEAGLCGGDRKRAGSTERVSKTPVSPGPDQPDAYLGCARGVLWALLFEAGLVIAALACWKLHLFALVFARAAQ